MADILIFSSGKASYDLRVWKVESRVGKANFELGKLGFKLENVEF